MKQLLSTCGHYFLVGLNKKAFFFSSESNFVSELVIASNNKSASADTESQRQVPKSSKSPNEDLDDIQAVHFIQGTPGSGEFWCGVSRGDKSVAIYKLNENESRPKVGCSIVYNTPKRCAHLCFASLPNKSGEKSEPGQLCLVTGDLAGDAHAYSLAGKRSKLLLGHTASMLTGVLVLGSRILTADRDEKIRVSRFPEAYVVEGYLLGHSKYVTSIDAVTTKNGFNLVASCGGDCTVRLWALDTTQQLSETAVGLSASDENTQLIPTNIALHPEGGMVAVIYDQSKRLDVYSIEPGDSGKPQLGNLVQSLECAAQPLSIVFQNIETLVTLMKEPDYIVSYKVNNKEIVPEKESTERLRQTAASNNIVMPETILERDSYGNIKLEKLSETRGPSGEDAPWNRIERVDIAKERQKRHKKRKLEQKLALKKEKEANSL
jgi:WD40 repeat protein